MDFKVTRVIQSRAIFDPNSRDTVTAPAGQRFIVIECVVVNRTGSAEVFEPKRFAGGRDTLYLYTAAGEEMSPKALTLPTTSPRTYPRPG